MENGKKRSLFHMLKGFSHVKNTPFHGKHAIGALFKGYEKHSNGNILQ
jgi:hypothetical protein